MKKAKLPKFNLKALNDIYIIEEDPLDVQVASDSGLTKDVASAIKEKRLIIPDAYQDFAVKFPCTGKVMYRGDDTKYNIKIRSRVIFARLGGQRYEIEGKKYINVRECDIHAVLED